MNNKKDSTISLINGPFYTPILKRVLGSLEGGADFKKIYDSRGLNISRALGWVVSKTRYDKVLDIGCGLGQVSISLSSKSEMVVAVDVSIEALKITNIVAKRSGIKNLHTVLVDSTNLPFRQNTYDLILCSGVLEWVPVSHKSQNSPMLSQKAMLHEVRRVLGYSGSFWLGIENRYGFNYMLGGLDHHSGLRLATFLPRFLANFYSQKVKKHAYQNYLYNYWEMKRILSISGLFVSKFLTAFPQYANPKYISSINDYDGIIRLMCLTENRLSKPTKILNRLIAHLRLTKIFTHSFVIICNPSFLRNEKQMS